MQFISTNYIAITEMPPQKRQMSSRQLNAELEVHIYVYMYV